MGPLLLVIVVLAAPADVATAGVATAGVATADVATADSATADRILEVGLQRGLDSLRAAEALFEQEANPTREDQYALGLVRLRHTRHTAAMNLIEPFRGNASFLQGWEAALRLMADRDRYEEIIADLPKFAAAVGEVGHPGEAEDLARRAGRLTAAVELAAGDSARADAAQPEVAAGGMAAEGAVWVACLEALPSPLQPAFDAGYEEVLESAAARVSQMRERHRRVREARKDRLLESTVNVEKIAAAVEETAEGLDDSVRDWAAVFDERRQEAESRLMGLVERGRILSRQRDVTVTLIASLSRQIERERRLSSQEEERRQRAARRQGIVLLRPEDVLLTRLSEAMTDLTVIEMRIDEVSTEAARLQAAVRTAAASLQQQSGRVAAEKTELAEMSDKATRRLARLQEELQATVDEPLPKVRRPSVRSLLDWDFEAERLRLRG